MPIINYQKIINLSHSISDRIPIWPGDPPVIFHQVAKIDQQGFYLQNFSLGEHSGTHINAPISFDPQGKSIDDYLPEDLILKAIVIDVTNQANNNPDYQLTISDILNWEARFNSIPADSLVILHTGWQKYWHNPRDFFNNNHFPGFGEEAIAWLLKNRQIKGIAIDTHGVDGGQNYDFTINKMMLKESRIVLENLTNLDQLPPTGITIIIGILSLMKGSGSPVSILALI